MGNKRSYSKAFGKRRTGGRQYTKRPRFTTAKNGGKGYKRAVRNVPTLGINIVKAVHKYVTWVRPSKTEHVMPLAFDFNAAAFPGANNLLKVFDAYRITRFDCTLTNITPGAKMKTGYWPTVYMTNDENQDNAVPTLDWIKGKSQTISKLLSEGKAMHYSFVPTVTNRTGLKGSYSQNQMQWMTSVSSTEPHHGLKIVVNNFDNADQPILELTVKAHIQYKGMGLAD